MDDTRLARLRDELEKARKKRDDWDTRVKDLEKKYKEAENTCIHDMVHAANLTPEGAEPYRAELSEITVCARLSGLPDHDLHSYLCGAGPDSGIH